MSDCCSNSATTNTTGKSVCPLNQKTYSKVSRRTVQFHLQQPWENRLTEQSYYFCDDPDCEVVYFGDNGQIISENDLRHSVGIKDNTDNAMLCYCFNIHRSDIQQHQGLREYVIQQTSDAQCACEVLNPSGRCCLKDFPKN